MITMESVLILQVATLLFGCIICGGSGANEHLTIYVKDTRSAHCPDHVTECMTLTDLSRDHTLQSDTTLVLSPGTHLIEQDSIIFAENIENLAIIGQNFDSSEISSHNGNYTEIVCSEYFAFLLIDVWNITLTGIKMVNCAYGNLDIDLITDDNFCVLRNSGTSYCVDTPSTIAIMNSSDVTIDSVTVSYSKGIALLFQNVSGNVMVTESMFYSNAYHIMVSDLYSFTLSSEFYHESFVRLHFKDSEFIFDTNDNDSNGVLIQLSRTETFVMFENLTFYQSIRQLRYYDISFAITAVDKANIFMTGCNLNGIGTPILFFLGGTVDFSILDSNFFNACLSVRSESNSNFPTHVNVLVRQLYFQDAFCKFESELGLPSLYLVGITGFLEDIEITKSQTSIIEARNSTITISGICLFYANGGGMNILENSMLSFDEWSEIYFMDNKCLSNVVVCSTLYSFSSKIEVHHGSNLVFENNIGKYSGGITLALSTLQIMFANVTFTGNQGNNGGALSLYIGSKIMFHVSSYRNDWMLTFKKNHATQYGGAIFVDDFSYGFLREPFIELHDPYDSYSDSPLCKEVIGFIESTADVSGNALFGGWIDYNLGCNFADDLFYLDTEYDRFIKDDYNQYDPAISSNPIRICMCEPKNEWQFFPEPCDKSEYTFELYHGQTIKVEVVAVGQRFGAVPSVVHASFDSTNSDKNISQLSSGQYVQNVNKTCTLLEFTVLSTKDNETLRLRSEDQINSNIFLVPANTEPNESIEDVEIDKLFEQLSLIIQFIACPVGFTFDNSTRKCACDLSLLSYKITDCDIDTSRIVKPTKKWINATFIHTASNSGHGVIVHDHCPLDYCINGEDISLDLEYPDEQCAFSRSGVLCGACRTNYSHVLGSSKCRKCSNCCTILYLLPAFSLAGIALVAFLISLNLTVTVGTINGLIFYTNILQANHHIFHTPNTFLSIFIAWLNLDLGIEVCLFNGLDAYIKTWLQFVFPLYIWFIVITIIVVCRYSDIAARLCGNNAVQVLATLFLLSYAKLLRVIITVLQPTVLLYPDGYRQHVWLYDGNIEYLKGKHIPLFIVALSLLVFLSIPYTTSLLFIQWLRKHNHYRILFWVHKLKPILDAHTGPYKDKHCYWTGFLLLIRVILFIVFSVNVSGDASVNLLAIGIIMCSLLTYLSLIDGVYKSQLLNVIELSFFLNISLLTLATLYDNNNTTPITNTSIAIALGSFITIILYHIYLRIVSTERGGRLKEVVTTKIKKTQANTVMLRLIHPVSVQAPVTRSSIELRESLLVDVVNTSTEN